MKLIEMVYRRIFKPAADRLLAAAGLIVTLPIVVFLAMSFRLRMGRPVVFRRTRIGLNNALFGFLKFRTMTQDRDSEGRLLPDARRLTPFGRFLRASSLDELPQLWNVFKGEMSLIGPRPLLPDYLPRCSPVQRRRHEVKPGITGLAQVKGRNSLGWEGKFDLDVWYVEPLGFFDFVHLEQSAFCLLSDSGTVQEEACIFGVPNVTVRDVTERPETIECGSNILCGAAPDDVLRAVRMVTAQSGRWKPPEEYLAPAVAETVCRIVLGFRLPDSAEMVWRSQPGAQ